MPPREPPRQEVVTLKSYLIEHPFEWASGNRRLKR